MKRSLLVLAASLVLAAPAAAKELTSVTVCGASDCTTVDSRATAERLAHMGETVGHAAAPGPYYVVTFEGDAEGERFGWNAFWVPGGELWASFDDMYGTVRWSSASTGAAAALARTVEGLDPFPAPELEAVRVDGRAIDADPQSYLRLFTVEAGGRRGTEPSTYDWVPVDLVAAASTPWTASDRDLMFSPSAGAIERVGARIPLDGPTARAVAAGDTLPAPGRELPWTAILAALTGVALAAALVWLRRLSLAPRRQPKPV